MESNLSKSARQNFWEMHIAQCNVSGMSQVEYCRTNKIGLKSFQYWKRKLKRNGAPPALVEVPLTKTAMVPVLPAQLFLHIGQHYHIEIRQGFDSDDLERVVRVLGRI